MCTVGHCSYNTRFTVSECRHRIKEMRHMIRTKRKRFIRGIIIAACMSNRNFRMCIIRIGMCKRNVHFIFHCFYKCNCVLAFFRRKSYKLHKAFRSIKESLTNVRITRHDISFILRSFFHRADERAFHVHAYKIRSLRILLFFVFCCCS